MKIKRLVSLVFVTIITCFVVGCRNTQEEASPSCADLEQITDPIRREELIKKCPRYIQAKPEPAKQEIIQDLPEPTKQKKIREVQKPIKQHGAGFKHSQMKQW
jgi:nitrous oxide reductase accessory protein NosL